MKRFWSRLVLIGFLVLTLTARAQPLVSSPVQPQVISLGAAADCHNPESSADGRFVVFVCAADNLVTNDDNGALDVFVRDRQLGKTILVSVNASGTHSGHGASYSPSISSNGQFVVFESTASDLTVHDTNQAPDVFLRDLATGTTVLVSQIPGGYSANLESSSPYLTPDAQYVLYSSRASNLAAGDANNAADLLVWDRSRGTNILVTRSYTKTTSHAGRSPFWGGNYQLSDDGLWVAFHSPATNLIRTDSNGKSDVFVRNLQAETNLLASVNSTGSGVGNGYSENASMDATGRYVVFHSAASNLVTNDNNVNLDVFWRDLVTQRTVLVSVNTNRTSTTTAQSGSPFLNKLGNTVVFLSTANNLTATDSNTTGADLFLRDLEAATTILVDTNVAQTSSSVPASSSIPVLSADGHFVLYLDARKNLVLFNALTASRLTLATNAPGADATMTADAHFIVFIGPSEPTGTRNIYLYDRLAETTELVSLREPTLSLATGSASSRVPPGGIISNGQWFAFESYAADLSPGSNYGTREVWLCDLNPGSPVVVRLNSLIDGFARGPARNPVVSAEGSWLAFEAIPDSTPLVNLATRHNLYAFDRVTRTNVLIAGVGKANAPSQAELDAQGTALVFQSSETGVGGFATTVSQVYYRVLAEETNRLVSLNYSGTAPGPVASFDPRLSPDGRYVAYLSGSAGLVTNTTSGTNAYLWDSTTGSNILVSTLASGSSLGQITQVAFGASGHLVSFQRSTTNYLFDITPQAIVDTLRDATQVSLSADGRRLACERTNAYSPLDTNAQGDVYVIDRSTQQATLVSVNHEGTAAGNGRSLSPWITPDGRYVLFRSRASNLVAHDTNGVGDLFLRDLTLNRTILLSLNREGASAGNRLSSRPVLSGDGSTILFESYASDLVAGDYNATRDILMVRLSRGDSDGDGLPDDWELAYFNLLDRDGKGDFDGDGQADGAEYHAATDPTNTGSLLQVLTLSSPMSGPVRIFWMAIPGKKYRVQFKDSLSDPSWTDLPQEILAADTTGFLEDTSTGANSQRFYRLRLAP